MPLVPALVVPSPQFSTSVRVSPSGSVQLPLAVTLRGTMPLVGETERVQAGGWFEVTVIAGELVLLVLDRRSLAVTVTT